MLKNDKSFEEKAKSFLKQENKIFDDNLRLEFPATNIKLFQEEKNLVNLYFTSAQGFVFCFENVGEKKLVYGKKIISEEEENDCITSFHLEIIDKNKIIMITFFNGIIKLYGKDEEMVNLAENFKTLQLISQSKIRMFFVFYFEIYNFQTKDFLN